MFLQHNIYDVDIDNMRFLCSSSVTFLFLSQVTITLTGTEGESDPHHLTDPEKPVFERGGVDMFLLTTHFSLGDLQSIRLWHDNSGEHPAWYARDSC